MKYQIVSAVSATDLEARVNSEIDRGWRPIGGVAYAPPRHSGTMPAFLQAMVLETGERD